MKFPPAAKASFLLLATLAPSMGFSAAAARTVARRQASRQVISTSRASSSAAANLVANSWVSANTCPRNRNVALPSLRALPGNGLLSLRGGSALHSTVAAEVEAEAAPQEIFRSDYKPLPFKVSNVSMKFDIRDGKTVVER